MQLGPFKVEHPFILAPMAGITNSPYRRLMRRFGSAVVVSELVSANGIEYMGNKTLDLLKFHEEERLVGLQIFGEDEDRLVRAAQYVEKLGADFVDLNLGCPVPKVVSKGAGSAMCRNPPALGKILEAMVNAVKIPVTIKIRTGWDSGTKNASEVVHVARESGVGWVAVHGRTRAQGYSGLADWDFIAEVKAKARMSIIGNGDVQTPEQAVKRYTESGVDGVMIGRGVLRNPFLLEQSRDLLETGSYKTPSTERYAELFQLQRGYLSETYVEKVATLHAKKFLAWYAAGFPDCHEFRRKVFQFTDEASLWKEAMDFFLPRLAARDEKFLVQPFLMGGHG